MTKVIDLTYDKATVNVALLDEELAAALGEKFKGISTGGGKVRVHIQDDMPQVDQGQIEAIVMAHDDTQLTAAQQAEVDRQAVLDGLRKPWAEWTTQDQADFIRILAEQAGLIAVE